MFFAVFFFILFIYFLQQIGEQTFGQSNVNKTRGQHLDPQGCISLTLCDVCQSQHSGHRVINFADNSVILSVAKKKKKTTANFICWCDS